jgi:NADP-dependent 3-hydroxy acid dehydrogenase YdfG
MTRTVLITGCSSGFGEASPWFRLGGEEWTLYALLYHGSPCHG